MTLSTNALASKDYLLHIMSKSFPKMWGKD